MHNSAGIWLQGRISLGTSYIVLYTLCMSGELGIIINFVMGACMHDV